MFRLVLFDIDGTLIHSGGAGEKAFAKVCGSMFNVPNGTAQLRFAGRTDTSIVREFFTQHQIPPSPGNFEHFFDCYVFWLEQMLEATPGRVLPGVSKLLARFQALSEPPAIGLLTGNIRLGAEIKLRHYQLWDAFVTGGFGDDHEQRNCVAGVALERGQKLLGQKVSGEQVLVIGDTPLDIECARAINACVLAVATGNFTLDQLKKEQPDWAASTLDEISLNDLTR
jgi:phosphoglycolate phosphatase-like HAD superfamily hydrolase